MSSSDASSWILVAITIQPSMLRTATAFCAVRASVPALVVDFFVSFGDGGALAGGPESTSISVDIVGRFARGF